MLPQSQSILTADVLVEAADIVQIASSHGCHGCSWIISPFRPGAMVALNRVAQVFSNKVSQSGAVVALAVRYYMLICAQPILMQQRGEIFFET